MQLTNVPDHYYLQLYSRDMLGTILCLFLLAPNSRVDATVPIKRVAVVVMDGFETLDALGPHSVFQSVEIEDYKHINISDHSWLVNASGSIVSTAQVQVSLVGPSLSPVTSRQGVRVTPDATITDQHEYDLVVIPAGVDTTETQEFVKAVSTHGGSIMSVCTGAVVPAKLGLLDGKQATSNSLFLGRFRRDFPSVHWVSLRGNLKQRFIESVPPLRVVTTAGVTAGIDGALQFVSSWCGRSTAEATRELLEWPLPLES